MTLAKPRFLLMVVAFLLPPLCFQGCLSTTRYRANPKIHVGTYVDIWSFSDAEIDPKAVDDLFLQVARLMDIVPNESTPRPQVLIVSPTYIRHKYLSIHPSAKTRSEGAVALYIPRRAQILIPYFDRTLLTHELAHHFTYHYVAASRSSWEWIAEKTVKHERVIRRRDRTQKPDTDPRSGRSPSQSRNGQTIDAGF